jgi:hypothetical protein
MPLRILAPITLLLLALALASSACGGDDDGGDGGSPAPTALPSATPSGSEPPETEDPGEDEKTPGAEETPAPGETTDPNTGPSATPGVGGIPAVAPADQAGFLAGFADTTVEQSDCTYDPGTLIAGCGEHGDFSVDPPLTGQDISCAIGLVDGSPVFVQCSSQVPLTTIYYEILG